MHPFLSGIKKHLLHSVFIHDITRPLFVYTLHKNITSYVANMDIGGTTHFVELKINTMHNELNVKIANFVHI